MTKIRLLVSVGGDDYAWYPGEVVDLPEDRAAVWADGVRAEYVDAPPPDRRTTAAPPVETTNAPPATETTSPRRPAKATPRRTAAKATSRARGKTAPGTPTDG